MSKDRFSKVVIGVLATIYNSKGEVLFIKQRSGPYGGHWLIPGGGIHFGESSVDAVKREVKEETGIKITNPEYKSMYVMRGDWSEGEYHLVMFGFKCQSNENIPENFNGDNVDDIRWAKPNEINLHSTDKLILTDCGVASFSKEEISESLNEQKVHVDVYPKSEVPLL